MSNSCTFFPCFSLKDLLQNMGDNFTADEVSLKCCLYTERERERERDGRTERGRERGREKERERDFKEAGQKRRAFIRRMTDPESRPTVDSKCTENN